MHKLRNKRVCLLLAIVFAMTMIFPFSAFAADSTTEYKSNGETPYYEDDTDNAELGGVIIEFNNLKDDIIGGSDIHQAEVSLPDDFDINEVTVNSSAYDVDAYATKVDDNSFILNVDPDGDVAEAEVEILFNDVDIPEGAEPGPIKATFNAVSGQLNDYSVTIGYVSGGELVLDVVEDDNFSDEGGNVVVRVKETSVGVLDADDELNILLPNGLEWNDVDVEDIDVVYGDILAENIDVDVDEEELTITLNNDANKSKVKSAIDFTLDIDVEDYDEDGEIIARVKGDYDVDPSELELGYYGDFAVNVEADDPDTEIYSGRIDQEVSDITIEESIVGSLLDNRVIEFTLPENARWEKIGDDYLDREKIDADEDDDVIFEGDAITDEDEGVWLEFVKLSDDDRTLRAKIQVEEGTDDDGDTYTIDRKDAGYDEAKLELKDITVLTQPAVTGDLEVEIDTNCCNVTPDTLKIATIINPIKVSVVEKTPIEIGYQDQAVADIVITEAKDGAIRDNLGDLVKEGYWWDEEDSAWLGLVLPKGIEFSGKPEVEVTDGGDIKLGDTDIDNDGWSTFDLDDAVFWVEIERDSNDISEITISNIKYDLDRTMPYGDIEVAISGSAIYDWQCYDGPDDMEGYWDNYAQAYAVNATVATPAPSTVKASFALGDEGVAIQNGRTLVQVNKLCDVLGLQKSWDATTKTAYFVKDGKVVAFPMGENAIYINGSKIPVDQGGKIINDFTYATLRGIEMAFGGELTWDDATKTATFVFEGRAN